MPRRPDSARAPRATAPDKGKTRAELSKLPGGLYIANIRKARGQITGAANVIYKQRAYNIPVDSNGNIPSDLAIARLMDTDEGDRTGKRRNAFVDLAVTADTVAPDKAGMSLNKSEKEDFQTDTDRALQYLWWIYPNEMDFKGVDEIGSDWQARTKGRGGSAIAITGASDKERAAIIQIINKNFTNKERELMRGLVIEVRTRLNRGAAGMYLQARGGVTFDKILLHRSYIFKAPDKAGPNKGDDVYDETLTHELIHHLRTKDPRREKYTLAKAPPYVTGKDKDAEETFTDGETVARMRIAPSDKKAGYYWKINQRRLPEGLQSNQHDAAVTHDKLIFMGLRDDKGIVTYQPTQVNEEVQQEKVSDNGGPAVMKKARLSIWTHGERRFETVKQRDDAVKKMFKGKRGISAIKKISKEFPNTAISRAKIHGKKEAIDTYWDYKDTVEGVGDIRFSAHVYSPKGDLDRRVGKGLWKNITGGLGDGKKGVSEWRDGKKVRLG